MKVQSFIRLGPELAPVEIELTLVQGLPQILFLGLPDAALKESALRIRTALREQGFELPQAHQILVNLKPTYLRKSSRGLDLAVAAALLWETEQVPLPEFSVPPILYGELTLRGEVVRPDDMDVIPYADSTSPFYTGAGQTDLPIGSLQLRELRELLAPVWVEGVAPEMSWMRPRAIARRFPRPAAELAMVVAAGEHSALFAGPPGGGKTTLVDSFGAWVEGPEAEAFRRAQLLALHVGRKLAWRPALKPHHSITPLAMIGGGNSLWAGEISRAHGGLLILDELLKFHTQIQEALREPAETGQITIARAGSVRTFPARFLMLATTNLCPCGWFVPRRDNRCRCASALRRRELARLTGPFADRFAIIALTDEWAKSKESVASDEIAERVARAIEFRKRRGQARPNGFLSEEDLENELSNFQSTHLMAGQIHSRRRHLQILRVARTLADLRESETIANEDLDQALKLSLSTHRALEQWRD